MKLAPATDADRAFREEFCKLMARHYGDQSSERILAVAAFTVGQIIALQDQRTITPQQAMQIVRENIEEGNRTAVEALAMNTAGSA